MSDPMTNTEVEDVLASIRRLVSDDNGPVPQEKMPAPSDRLVLTPALRVTDDVAAQDDDDDAGDVDDDLERDDVSDSADPELADESAEFAENDLQSDAALNDDLDAETPVTDDMEIVEEGEPITLDTVDLDRDTLMSIQDAFADIDQENTPDPEPEVEAEPAMDASSLSAKIAALETLIAGQADEFEPDMAGDGENAGTEPPTLEWEDASEEDDAEPEMAMADPELAIAAAPEETQIFSSDEDVLDEEALRDLVSDIVREE
ncbi:MAG: hypothetical protein AAFY64_10775, partial [Pseudomonadota bacterium]